MLELSVAALRPLIGRTERPTLTALAGVDDADQLDQGSFSPRALELLRSAVSTTFTLATVKVGVPIFRERASKKTGVPNDRCHLEAMVESGILAVLVHGTTCVPKFFVRKVPTAELTTEQKLALNSRLLAVGLNMDTYSAHAKPSKLDVTEAALGPVCSELPPGITGRKAPGFINDVPGLWLLPPRRPGTPLGRGRSMMILPAALVWIRWSLSSRLAISEMAVLTAQSAPALPTSSVCPSSESLTP